MRKWLLIPLLVATAAGATAGSVRVLNEAQQLQERFREGDRAAAPALVRTLEHATREWASDSDVWTALGRAYFSQISSLAGQQGSAQERLALVERARDAYARALELSPGDGVALSGHGMAVTILGGFKRDENSIRTGIAEMNEAVVRNPKLTPARLIRAFTTINLPAPHRDSNAVISDLNYLIDEVPGSRAADVLYLILGDLHAEQGDRAAARREWQSVADASLFAAEQARARLALGDAVLPMQDVMKIRGRLGSDCAMCHAK